MTNKKPLVNWSEAFTFDVWTKFRFPLNIMVKDGAGDTGVFHLMDDKNFYLGRLRVEDCLNQSTMRITKDLQEKLGIGE